MFLIREREQGINNIHLKNRKIQYYIIVVQIWGEIKIEDKSLSI